MQLLIIPVLARHLHNPDCIRYAWISNRRLTGGFSGSELFLICRNIRHEKVSSGVSLPHLLMVRKVLWELNYTFKTVEYKLHHHRVHMFFPFCFFFSTAINQIFHVKKLKNKKLKKKKNV